MIAIGLGIKTYSLTDNLAVGGAITDIIKKDISHKNTMAKSRDNDTQTPLDPNGFCFWLYNKSRMQALKVQIIVRIVGGQNL